jgi:hypothetical protein
MRVAETREARKGMQETGPGRLTGPWEDYHGGE